jgi:hypothetical protein
LDGFYFTKVEFVDGFSIPPDGDVMDMEGLVSRVIIDADVGVFLDSIHCQHLDFVPGERSFLRNMILSLKQQVGVSPFSGLVGSICGFRFGFDPIRNGRGFYLGK